MPIPVIDFSKLDGEERAATMAQIAIGCEEWGFFQLVNHGIPVDLLERVKKVTTECYKTEREERFFKNSTPVNRLKELIEAKNGDKLENIDWEDVFLLTDDYEWPEKTLGFKETMMEYRAELKKLAEKVMEVMDENLGLQKGHIKKVLNGGDGEKAFFGTKVSHYPPCPHPEMVNGLRAHTDAGGNQMVSHVGYPRFVFGDYMSVYTQQKFLPKEPRFQAVRAV
ncbi:hypothetical protein E3N88_45453 [Mikania micrantha]|uniref:Non-haem dioxygenase N-terminal domain-containing protein n=1 Tax=Mikania micrantha TaxID=192012 RepID=A0A5N6L942_9ASTR|nr:hypothetical protein E3N88_46347 [Mikania micrantha]KAC9657506.1 hypothetical protein E3N88_45453 [Mikania micrantha]